MKYKALNDYVVIKKLEKVDKTSTFVIIDQKSTLNQGQVISVNESNEESFKEGDIILYPEGVGLEIEHDLLAIAQEHIICKVVKE